MLLDQPPLKWGINWLWVNADGYKIVNIHKPPPTQLQSLDILVFPQSCHYAGDFNFCHVDWDYDDNIPNDECLVGWASIYSFALLYNVRMRQQAFTLVSETLAPIQFQFSPA